MTSFTDSNYFIFPSAYIENPNMFQVKSVYQTNDTDCGDEIEKIKSFLDNDFDKNFELHIKENGLKEGNDEIDEIVDFRDTYPYCYFFIDFDYLNLNFRDKNIFIIELINLLDISEETKTEVLEDFAENIYMVVKLRHLPRNLNTDPLPVNSNLKQYQLK